MNRNLIAVFIIFGLSCNQNEQTSAEVVSNENLIPKTNPVNPSQAGADKNKVTGIWIRTDAPYNLKIVELLGDGNMKAEYFNPKSIHIGKSVWIEENGVIKIYVEFRDENYPGSNYTLFYMPDRDLLAGKYFQAVESVTYDVGFMRAK